MPRLPKKPLLFAASHFVVLGLGALQEHLDSLNQDRGFDSFYAEALISRWMSLDPRAAMLFVGQMVLRTGWGASWPALFKNSCQLSGLELFEMMRDSWSPNNRGKDYLKSTSGLDLELFQKAALGSNAVEILEMLDAHSNSLKK